MQRREFRWKVQLRRYTAIFGPVLDVILERDGEPEAVEKHRTQTGDDATLRAHRRTEQGDDLLLFVYQLRRNFLQLFLQPAEPHGKHGKQGTHVVVQFAGKLGALAFRYLEQMMRQLGQLGCARDDLFGESVM